MPGIIKALERVGPHRRFTLPATANNRSLPGDIIKFTFTNVASLEQIFRYADSPLQETFVSVKTTADLHLVFGRSNANQGIAIVVPTTGDLLLQASDSWQDWQLSAGDDMFKTIGDTTGGDLYLLLSGR